MLSDLLQQEFWLLQLPFWSTIVGIVFVALYWLRGDEDDVKRGLLAFMASGIMVIPLYFVGEQIVATMQEMNHSDSAIDAYEMDHLTTVIIFMFMSITALMSWLMRKSLEYVPTFFLVLIELYGIIVVAYTAWRQWISY
ncbi:MAG: hypothetical protein ACQETE_00295 [Bacteroidota bacterium]